MLLKSTTIKKAVLFIIIAAFPLISKGKTRDDENERLLLRLDSIIESTPSLVSQKDGRIDALRVRLSRSRSDADRMALTQQLFDEYDVYDSDSALYYARETRRLAEQLYPESYNIIAQWKLNEASIDILQGLYDQTMPLLESIDPSKLSAEMRADYYGILANAHAMRSIYVKSNEEKWREDLDFANEYRDSIQSVYSQLSDEWLWVPVALAIDTEDGDISSIDIYKLKTEVDLRNDPSRQNAINAYWLARYYDAVGDEKSMVKYMAKAATYDAMIINRDIAALEELAIYLFNNGQLNRAHNYLLYAASQANLYHNRYRMVSLSDVLPMVRDAYRQEVEKRDSRLSKLVIVLAVLSVILLASLVFIVFEFRKLKKMKDTIRQANSRLNVSIGERDKAIKGLSEVNAELSEANKQKIGVLAYALKLTTQYINALDEYRKKLLRKYKIKRFDELGALLNDPELVKDQYQGFYESFDKTVLSIFPDFIDEYNSSVTEDCRVSAAQIAKSRTLNTKLRIHALRRLGVSKSADIASMLNLSIRTVYNNRQSGAATSDDSLD